MHAVIGPIVTRAGGYAFDSWTPDTGLSRSYSYRRIEDAHYARNVEIRSRTKDFGGRMVACGTIDEFTTALAARPIALLGARTPAPSLLTAPTDPPSQRPNPS